MKLKYIVYENGDGSEYFILFPIFIKHDTFEYSFRHIISAGFVNINNDIGQCYGKSESLDKQSRIEDSELITREINFKE
jgi:hypothetical protein